MYIDAIDNVARIEIKTDAGTGVWVHGARYAHCKYDDEFTISRVVAPYGGGKWYLLFNADCFDPAKALIQADTFQDAYDTFLRECEDWVKIRDEDLKDYLKEGKTDKDDDAYVDYVTWNDNGVPVDTEAIQHLEVLSIVFECR